MKKGVELSILIIMSIFLFSIFPVNAQEETICSIYITGIGCPNCAFTDTVLLTEFTSANPNLIVIEYEIYHLGSYNRDIANQYFESYLPKTQPGVPFIIFDKNKTGLGRFEVLDAEETIKELNSNPCALADGSSIYFKELNLVDLPGKVNIWTKNRILISNGTGSGSNQILKELLITDNLSSALEKVDFQEIGCFPVAVSEAEVEFENAIKLDGWILQWNGKSTEITNGINHVNEFKSTPLIIFFLIFLSILFLIYRFFTKKKICCIPKFTSKQKNFLITGIAIFLLIGFFILAKNISSDYLKQIGYTLPLPVFTFFIALIDGFNPCNLFVLTFLLGLLVSVSHSRKRIYTIGFTFVFMIFLIYFLFMAAWLNIFKYIGFITPLRIAIALIALTAGIINCKELLFFRKGITLMIQEKHKGLLARRIEKFKGIIQEASMPVLISSSIGLAAFASLVELPCTAGFPIIYTGILSAKVLSIFSYYLYLMLYNLIYIIPLLVIIIIFGQTFRTKQISKKQMQIIKFIGGLIMILLGIILLINPSLIGIGFG